MTFLAKGGITKDLIAMLANWRHSEFQVFCGQCIFPGIRKPWKTWLVHHAGFLLQRTDAESRRTLDGYLPGKGWDGRKRIEVLEWLSAICSHILDSREQMSRY
jgi:hypothetical protein